MPETRDCRHKTVTSDCFATDKEALTANLTKFVRHFQSTQTHLKEEAISRSASWQSSLEAARKESLDKKEKKSIERRKQIKLGAGLMRMRTMKVPVIVPSETAQFVPRVSTSTVETMSVASFVSVHSVKTRRIRPTSIEIAVLESCGNAEKRGLILIKMLKGQK